MLVFAVTLYVHLFVKEKESSKTNSANTSVSSIAEAQDNEEPPRNILQVLKQLSGFFTNKNLRLLLILLVTYHVGVSPVRSSFSAMLMKQGMKKEFISSVGSLMIPIGFIAAVVASKKIKVNSEMKVWRTVFLIMVAESIVGYMIVKYYNSVEK